MIAARLAARPVRSPFSLPGSRPPVRNILRIPFYRSDFLFERRRIQIQSEPRRIDLSQFVAVCVRARKQSRAIRFVRERSAQIRTPALSVFRSGRTKGHRRFSRCSDAMMLASGRFRPCLHFSRMGLVAGKGLRLYRPPAQTSRPCPNRGCQRDELENGAIAQLGERFNGIEEVVGSIPSGSTIFSR
jgi:hypothetical protein